MMCERVDYYRPAMSRYSVVFDTGDAMIDLAKAYEQDEACAVAGIEAVGLTADTGAEAATK